VEVHVIRVTKRITTILTDINQILERWNSYCQQLMTHPETTKNATLKKANVYESEPYKLKAKVEAALNKLKTHTSSGVDNITLEMIIATGETCITLFHKLCQSIWDTCT